MKKANIIKIILLSLVLAATIIDFVTFAIKPQFWAFDMSPLVVATKSILIIFLVKFGVIAGLAWLILKAYGADIWRFLWIMMCVYLIFAQILGAIANLQVAKSNPPPEAAPT